MNTTQDCSKGEGRINLKIVVFSTKIWYKMFTNVYTILLYIGLSKKKNT